MAALETTQLLTELEPVVEDNLNRHLSMADQDSLPVQRHGQLLSSTVELMKKLELPLSCLGFQ